MARGPRQAIPQTATKTPAALLMPGVLHADPNSGPAAGERRVGGGPTWDHLPRHPSGVVQRRSVGCRKRWLRINRLAVQKMSLTLLAETEYRLLRGFKPLASINRAADQ